DTANVTALTLLPHCAAGPVDRAIVLCARVNQGGIDRILGQIGELGGGQTAVQRCEAAEDSTLSGPEHATIAAYPHVGVDRLTCPVAPEGDGVHVNVYA